MGGLLLLLHFRWLVVRRNNREGGVAVGPVSGGWWKGQEAAGLWVRRYCVIFAARGWLKESVGSRRAGWLAVKEIACCCGAWWHGGSPWIASSDTSCYK
uniref:Secreted protein n=1 Tax=Populus trichocarpa TaxID=3694 RepID=B9NC36_POPTR